MRTPNKKYFLVGMRVSNPFLKSKTPLTVRTDGPYGPVVRTVSSDGLYRPSVWTVRTGGPSGLSVRALELSLLPEEAIQASTLYNASKFLTVDDLEVTVRVLP